MFSRKEENSNQEHVQSSFAREFTPESRPTGVSNSSSVKENLIAQGTQVNGDFHCESNIRVSGKVMGKIFCNAKVIIDKGGFVDGNIECAEGEIYGHVKGKLTVKDYLSLRTEANVEGDILTSHLEMEPTVKFNGNCTIKDDLHLSEAPQKSFRPEPMGNSLQPPLTPVTTEEEDDEEEEA